MTLDEINRLVKCERDEDEDDDLTFQFDKIKHATGKAVLVTVDGDEVWIPYTHLVHWWPESSEAQISGWLASQKGLL